MIKPGEWHRAKYWGRFHINKVAELSEPAVFDTPQWGKSSFRPTSNLGNRSPSVSGPRGGYVSCLCS